MQIYDYFPINQLIQSKKTNQYYAIIFFTDSHKPEEIIYCICPENIDYKFFKKIIREKFKNDSVYILFNVVEIEEQLN